VHGIDGKRGRIIADGTCLRVPEETPNAPTFEEMMANQAQQLKDQLVKARESCVDEFRSSVLTVGSAR
jgi:hypothetical protein